MAEKQCNLLKNWGGMSKVKVIATANANQTFGQQLAQIKSAYNTLTNDERYASFIALERATYEEVCPYGGMHYSAAWVNANLSISVFTWDLNNNNVKQLYGTTSTDLTNVTNDAPIKLCVFI